MIKIGENIANLIYSWNIKEIMVNLTYNIQLKQNGAQVCYEPKNWSFC